MGILSKLETNSHKYGFIYTKNKGIFLYLSFLGIIIIAFLLFFLWYFTRLSFNQINPWISTIIGILFTAFIIILAGGWLLITLSAVFEIDLLYPHGGTPVTMTVLLPFIKFLGKLIGIDKNQIRNSFIAINNALVIAQRKRIAHSPVLILLPHCIQLYDCPFKITHDIYNCKRCGKCQIPQIIDLMEKYNVKAAIATGGTLARKIVIENKPSFILAVACERDLADGIQDVYPIPVIGLLNERPFGPCVNTRIDIDAMDKILHYIMVQSKANKKNQK